MAEQEYKENPGIPYEGIKWAVERWEKKHIIIPDEQRKIYTTIASRSEGKSIVDVGCSFGVGSNILAHRAMGVWGLDLEQELVDFARALYASPRLTFDQMDILNPPATRPFATFDVVCFLEIIEHLPRDKWDSAILNLKRFFKPTTVGYISTPNRNAPQINSEHPNNTAHTYEATAGELYEFFIKHFQSVTMFGVEKLDTFEQTETVDGNSVETPILIKVEGVILSG